LNRRGENFAQQAAICCQTIAKTLARNHKTSRSSRFKHTASTAKHAAPSCHVTVRSRIIQGQTMPKKDKMEIKIAFWALAFFAAFMAGRSLTAYFKQK
jgi:hypothetical protein